MDSIKSLIKAIDELPLIVKVIFCFVDIVWALYRLARSIVANNTTGIVVNAVLLLFGGFFMWIVDLVCLLTKGQVWSLD